MAFSVSWKLFDIGATSVIRYLVGGARLNCSLVVPKIRHAGGEACYSASQQGNAGAYGGPFGQEENYRGDPSATWFWRISTEARGV